MDVFWLIFLFVLGACIGSFLNVVIYRIPIGESIVFPPSHCPSCGRGINWFDNIPILSWLLLRGRGRFCGTGISPRYILIEAATAILIVGLYVVYYLLGLRAGAGAFSDSWPMFAAHAALLCGLLGCSAVDIESWSVPLEICWVISAIGIISSRMVPHPFMLPVSPTIGAMGLGAVQAVRRGRGG